MQPIVVIEALDGTVVPWDTIVGYSYASTDEGLGDSKSNLFRSSDVTPSATGGWLAAARVRGATSEVESTSNLSVVWYNDHTLLIGLRSWSNGSTADSSIYGYTTAAADVRIRVLAGGTPATTATVRVTRLQSIVPESGDTGYGRVDDVVRHLTEDPFRCEETTVYTAAVGELLPVFQATTEVEVTGAGEAYGEVQLAFVVDAVDPCCGMDPCCGANCADQDPCTVDSCNNGACLNIPTGDPCCNVNCADQDPCTSDSCINGACIFTPNGDPCCNVNCNDQDPCTADSCSNGACLFIPNGDPCCGIHCDDQDPCTVDTCVNGACIFTGNSNECCGVSCNDGNPCTLDGCYNGSCVNTWTCQSDNDPCTDDFCDPSSGCAHPPKNCDDDNTCTGPDTCVNGACVNDWNCEPPIDPCVQRACVNGECETQAIDCDDQNACTGPDQCVNGQCSHPWNCGSPSDPCLMRTCVDGECEYVANTCDDGNPCTTDSCDSNAGGCQNVLTCEESNPCTEEECIGGACVHVWLCEDNDVCTSDCCVGGGCQHDRPPQGSGVQLPSIFGCRGEPVQLKGRVCNSSATCDETYAWEIVRTGGPAWAVVAGSGAGSVGLGPNQCADVLVTIDVHTLSPTGHAYFSLTATSSSDGTCGPVSESTSSVQGSVFVADNPLFAEYVDQDDPARDPNDPSDWSSLAPNWSLYGGSEPSTSDDLRLWVAPGAPEVVNIVWSWIGTGGGGMFNAPPTGAGATEWVVGRIHPIPGDVVFKVQLFYADDGTECREFPVRIGVRSDDIIVIGWIDPDGVSLPAGASTWLTTLLPPGGPPPSVPLDCNLMIFYLGSGDITPYPGPDNTPLPWIDRKYILNWLFKYAANINPQFFTGPLGFRDATDTYIDYDVLDSYLADPHSYKVFNHFQVKFLTDGNTFDGDPVVLREQTAVGITTNPCGSVAGFFGEFAGQEAFLNGPPAVTSTANHRISLINDGSPDAGIIKAFNTLMGNGVVIPKFWEDIGSQIAFRVDGGAQGLQVYQPYPTYFQYRNGTLVAIVTQHPQPYGNFQSNPHPFGTVPCLETPGGRCGDAVSPPDPSARVPRYVLP